MRRLSSLRNPCFRTSFASLKLRDEPKRSQTCHAVWLFLLLRTNNVSPLMLFLY